MGYQAPGTLGHIIASGTPEAQRKVLNIARFMRFAAEGVAERTIQLRLDRDCIGESIYIGPTRFMVVGLVEPPAEFNVIGAGGQEHEIFIPFTTSWRRNSWWMYVLVSAKTPEASEDARAEVRFFLRNRKELRPEDPDTFAPSPGLIAGLVFLGVLIALAVGAYFLIF